MEIEIQDVVYVPKGKIDVILLNSCDFYLEKFYFSNKNTFLLVTKLYYIDLIFFCFPICHLQLWISSKSRLITSLLLVWFYKKLLKVETSHILIDCYNCLQNKKCVELLKISSHHYSSLIIKDEEYLYHVLSSREILQRIRKVCSGIKNVGKLKWLDHCVDCNTVGHFIRNIDWRGLQDMNYTTKI